VLVESPGRLFRVAARAEEETVSLTVRDLFGAQWGIITFVPVVALSPNQLVCAGARAGPSTNPPLTGRAGRPPRRGPVAPMDTLGKQRSERRRVDDVRRGPALLRGGGSPL